MGERQEEGGGLDMIAPETRSPVMFLGRSIEVRPLTIGQIPAITRALRGIKIEAAFGAADGNIEDIDFMGLVADYGDQIIGAVAIAIGENSEDVANGDPAEFIDLAKAIMEVNSDFFIRKILPHILEGLVQAGTAIKSLSDGIGKTPSKPSSEQDTVTQK